MSAPAVRREVVELCQVAHRLGLIADGRGGYSRQRGVKLEVFGRAQAKAVAHELQTLGEVLGRLEQLTAPAPSRPATKLPAERSVARTVLVVLAHDQAGKDHDHLRVHTGLTDAELAVRVAGVGPNSVRPRRVELVRRGLVEAVPDTSPTRWRLTAMGDVLLAAGRG